MHVEGGMKHKEFDRISGNILFYISWKEVFQTLTEAHKTFFYNESELHEWLFLTRYIASYDMVAKKSQAAVA